MFRPGDHDLQPRASETRGSFGVRERWRQLYGPFIARTLRPERTYALLRIGSMDFAYSASDRYLRALGQSWSAGFEPDPLPAVAGRDLPTVARRLQGVDVDLSGLSVADLARRLRS
jgi:hypothetical protein